MTMYLAYANRRDQLVITKYQGPAHFQDLHRHIKRLVGRFEARNKVDARRIALDIVRGDG
jgi:hypothetical protein